MPPSVDDLSAAQLAVLERLLTGAPEPDPGAAAELTAYYVPTEGAAPTESELRAHLAGALPAGQPVRLVAVDALPGPSGTAPAATPPAPGAPAAADPPAAAGEGPGNRAPAGDVERWIAAVWAAVLDVPVTSAGDDFFRLGGSSLRAVQVLARLQSVLGVELELVTLFENRTVSALAAALERQSDRVPGFAEIVSVAAEVYASET
ncbi:MULTISPECIES: phosphopantetheine-binding protein [Streptomyces]|uniref:phosphopantetheine-binding protein n=1 Tax=Streptomyces TaxID=1883 RepID=UPI002249531E|nr:phosphopantetheine-binding protein [Streptomyces sp. JHD 1]MCX2969314.1 phosphopantetheine-binding protein [Streptomyces sp. JHD 1]